MTLRRTMGLWPRTHIHTHTHTHTHTNKPPRAGVQTNCPYQYYASTVLVIHCSNLHLPKKLRLCRHPFSEHNNLAKRFQCLFHTMIINLMESTAVRYYGHTQNGDPVVRVNEKVKHRHSRGSRPYAWRNISGWRRARRCTSNTWWRLCTWPRWSSPGCAASWRRTRYIGRWGSCCRVVIERPRGSYSCTEVWPSGGPGRLTRCRGSPCQPTSIRWAPRMERGRYWGLFGSGGRVWGR